MSQMQPVLDRPGGDDLLNLPVVTSTTAIGRRRRPIAWASSSSSRW
jgi:hypothetical protein